MGIETAVIVMAAVSAGATVGKGVMEYKAEQANLKALDLQAKETQVQYQQKNLSNLDTMEKVLDAQAAALTTRGVSFSSPSFNAIERATLNIGAKEKKNLEIEESLYDENIRIEKTNARNSLYASLFGDAAQLTSNLASIGSKVPTTSGGTVAKLPQMGG